MKSLLVFAVATLFLTGCLKTRNEVSETEQRQVMQQQVSTMQRANADASSRFSDVDESMRNLNGRVEVLENNLNKSHSGVENALKNSQQQNQELNQKVMVLQDALTKMEKDMYAKIGRAHV